MKRKGIVVWLAIAQAYAWFAPHVIFQHLVLGANSGSQDMGLITIAPAWIWALLVSLGASFISYYQTKKFPWVNLILVGIVAVPVAVAVLFAGINLEVLGIIYRFAGLLPAGRGGWEAFDATAMTLILTTGFVFLRHTSEETA